MMLLKSFGDPETNGGGGFLFFTNYSVRPYLPTYKSMTYLPTYETTYKSRTYETRYYRLGYPNGDLV